MRRTIPLLLLGSLLPWGGVAGLPISFPPKKTVAQLGSCVDGQPRQAIVVNAASTSTCAVGGGAFEVVCCCLDGAWAPCAAAGVVGVTSVDFAAPAEFLVSGNPITGAGTITISEAVQGANTIYAGPTSGGAAVPGFRAITDADIPDSITVDVALTGDSATGFFPAGTLEATRLPPLSGLSGAVTDGQVPDDVTVNLAGTASQLAANGANCDPGQAARGTDAAGAAEGCFTPSAGLGGSTGATDNAALRADGTGGSAAQGSAATIDDTGSVTLPDAASFRWGDLQLTRQAGPFLRLVDSNGDPRSFRGRAYEAFNGSTLKAALDPAGRPGFTMASDACASWDSASTLYGGGVDFAICRSSAGVGKVGNGSGDYRLTAKAWQDVPQASPPVTCGDASTLGYEYTDTSGAKCWCDGAAWQKLAGSGTCA